MNYLLAEMRAKNAFICDMDGVIYHGDSNRILTGTIELVKKRCSCPRPLTDAKTAA